MNDSNLRSLQEYLPQVGIKDFDIPYEEFKANMELPENREAFYNYISPQMEELGTFEDFELNLADPTPLDRKPVEIPADDPQNQEDYVKLEQPIQDEKQKKLDQVPLDTEIQPVAEIPPQPEEDVLKESGFTLESWNKNVGDFNSALDNMITNTYVKVKYNTCF